jgi:hypothetical protein
MQTTICLVNGGTWHAPDANKPAGTRLASDPPELDGDGQVVYTRAMLLSSHSRWPVCTVPGVLIPVSEEQLVDASMPDCSQMVGQCVQRHSGMPAPWHGW